MGRIFLSHSSQNNAEAIALRDWMIAQGWEDLFLDLDPERGLKAGERWQAALKTAAARCQMVLFLISPQWVASRWCLAEFLLAMQMNKRIFGVVVAPTPFSDLPAEMTTEWQLVDLTAGPREYATTVTLPPGKESATVTFATNGLDRLRAGLLNAGLDPKYFSWPPEDDPARPPYRGLRPLEAEDAGIFFGRDGSIVQALDRLRGLREAAPPRLFVILGASGAGKSSFMRAGLLPRLARDDRHFLTLRAIRPERAVISGGEGLVASLEQKLKDAGMNRTRADIRSIIEGGAQRVSPLLRMLVEASAAVHSDGTDSATPTVILPIDQGEELFLAEGGKESQAFLTLLADLLTADAPAIIALLTIRSESYELLQSSPELENLRKVLFDLPIMPRGTYADIIRGPGRRLERSAGPLTIEDALVDALLTDVEDGGGKDALPLLAFTMERLYHECAGDRDLRLDEYRGLGGIQGSIEAAVERALDAAKTDPAIPNHRETRLELLRRGLIPWLAGIDPDTGAPRRRVARLSEIPAEARPLIRHLVDQRLLATDVAKDTGETTIEPAHEALLRQWGVLRGWLEEDAADLRVLEGVKRASRDWNAHAKDGAWLVHTRGRLEDAERLGERRDLAADLDPTDRRYLAACRDREDADHNAQAQRLKREKAQLTKIRRATRASGALGMLVLAAIVIAYNYYTVAIGQCVVGSVYTYKTGRFEKEGSTWAEYKGEHKFSTFAELNQNATVIYTELVQDAKFIYIADDTRIDPLIYEYSTEMDKRELIVRIPKCGGQVDWTWSNPLAWTPLQIATRAPLSWHEQLAETPRAWLGSLWRA